MITITSMTAKKIWTFLILFIIFLTASILTLKHGISLDNFNAPGIKISQLYIKLDKKLIVKIKKIDIKYKKAKKSSDEELINTIKKIPLLDKFFTSIDIQTMTFDDNIVKLLYKDEIFYLDTKFLTINAKIIPQEKDIKASISSLIFKDFDISFKGDLIGNIKKKTANFTGSFSTNGINGSTILRFNNDLLEYKIKSDEFSSLYPFMTSLKKKVNIEPEISDWIYKKIVAKKYKLHLLEGKINTKTYDFFPKQMKGLAYANDVSIRFHDDVPPAIIKDLDIKLINDTLFFSSKSGTYQKFEVKNPDAHIYNLLTGNTGIIINLKAHAYLNRDILAILSAFDIDVPVRQTSGTTDAILRLDVRFLPLGVDAKGIFKVNQSDILIANVPFKTSHALIELNNLYLTFTNTNLQYKNIFNANSNGLLDLHKFRYDGNVTAKSVNVDFYGQEFLNLKNKKFPLSIKINDDSFSIDIPTYKTKLDFLKDTNYITQTDLSLLYKYSPFMKEMEMYDGKIHIKTDDFKNFKIDAKVDKMKPFLAHKGKTIENLDLNITTHPSLHVKSKRDIFELSQTQNATIIDIKNSNILYDTNDSENSKEYKSKIILKGKNSNFILSDLNKTFLFDSYKITSKNNKVRFEAKYKNGEVNFVKKIDQLYLKAINLNDNFINTYINQDVFEEGKFDLELVGADFNSFMGILNIKDTYIESFAFYNNLIAFLNSIPSLMSFKQPGFNEKGYAIKDANILFEKQNRDIKIHAIDIKGVDADISGRGKLNLKEDTIQLHLQLKTFKGISNFIKYIPLVNYILLGKDKSIETAILVTGKISDPTIKTQTVEDIVTIPFNIIRRTLSLPFSFFEE